MSDDQQAGGLDPRWTVRLNQVERLDREEGDEGDEFFSVEFELSGLGVSGTVSAMVVDPANEKTIIGEALDMLLDGLERFVEVLRQRKGAHPIESTKS